MDRNDSDGGAMEYNEIHEIVSLMLISVKFCLKVVRLFYQIVCFYI